MSPSSRRCGLIRNYPLVCSSYEFLQGRGSVTADGVGKSRDVDGRQRHVTHAIGEGLRMIMSVTGEAPQVRQVKTAVP